MKTLCFVYGTRPEIIKLGPLMRQCREKRIPFFCIHTGQHYSYTMAKLFLKELALPLPDYQLSIKSRKPYLQGEHTGRMLIEIEKILLKRLPYCLIVQGDTNSTLAGALVAKKISTTKIFTGMEVKLAHVEAGLRSFNGNMPEECNRLIVDHMADFLFAPTATDKRLLLDEKIPPSRIHVTGNTIVDALKHVLPIARKKSQILKTLGLPKGSYLLLTLHRQENVDAYPVFRAIVEGLKKTQRRLNMPIIFPVHPRTAKILKQKQVTIPPGMTLTAPLGFLDFIWLESNAALIMTDSGGVQEEACILKVPCVTLRDSTERPDTVTVGANVVAGLTPTAITKAALSMIKKKRTWRNPLGDGRAAERMLKIMERAHG